MTVAAAVVNYNAAPHLAACVASLIGDGVDTVVVVDNGSTDDSLARLSAAALVPSPTVIQAGTNLGYGAGANRAVRELTQAAGAGAQEGGAASGAPILVCNSDLVVHPGTVKALVAALDADPTLGIVGPRVSNQDGTLYPSARTFPRLGDAIGHAVLGVVAPNNRYSRRYKLLDWDHETGRTVDWVSGACFLIRRATWDELGGFDESFFMYMEDVDLCWRAGHRGWRVAYEPAAEVTHVQGASTDQRPYRMIRAHHRSMLRFAARTTTGPSRALLPVMAVGLGLRTILASLHKWRSAHDRTRSRAAVQ